MFNVQCLKVESRHFEPAYRQVGDFMQLSVIKLYREALRLTNLIVPSRCGFGYARLNGTGRLSHRNWRQTNSPLERACPAFWRGVSLPAAGRGCVSFQDLGFQNPPSSLMAKPPPFVTREEPLLLSLGACLPLGRRSVICLFL